MMLEAKNNTLATPGVIHIQTTPGFEQWRDHARKFLAAGFLPNDIMWRADANAMSDLNPGEQMALDFKFPPATSSATATKENPSGKNAFKVPVKFLETARLVACHRDKRRFDLLYRILYRLRHENRQLLYHLSDDDVMALEKMRHAVCRDAYKIKAYLRFRQAPDSGDSPGENDHFIAWYEPEHYSLELALPFFTTRFKNMRWHILTPYRSAHWDTKRLSLSDAPDTSRYPDKDDVEQYWLTYYASIFNPVRLKTKAMLSQMPKKYWKNMPETVLIDEMVRNAHARVATMLES